MKGAEPHCGQNDIGTPRPKKSGKLLRLTGPDNEVYIGQGIYYKTGKVGLIL